MASYGILPTDPRMRELAANPQLLYFAYHWMKKHQQEEFTNYFNRFEQILGTTWTADMIKPRKGAKTSDEVFIPLALTIRPDLLKSVEKMVSTKKMSVVPDDKSEYVDLDELPRDQWQQYAQVVAAMFGRS